MRALGALFAAILAWMVPACGGRTTGPSGGGASSSSGGSGSSGSSGGSGPSSSGSSSGEMGCGTILTQTYPVDAAACEPQVESTQSCNGGVCSLTVVIPCEPDGGIGDAGAETGSDPWCAAVCGPVVPQGAPPSDFCSPQRVDGGALVVDCGGCGI